MSTQRRRVLGNSGLIIPGNGVFIEGIDGKVYTVNKWQGGNAANSVIFANGALKFRISLIRSEWMRISTNYDDPLENYMTAIPSHNQNVAKHDFDGAGNTAKIMQMQPSTDYSAGYCNAYIFPDGKTKGYLPTLGQLYFSCFYSSSINDALTACGGAKMYTDDEYQSSTFEGVDTFKSRICWSLNWGSCELFSNKNVADKLYVRPFADIS